MLSMTVPEVLRGGPDSTAPTGQAAGEHRAAFEEISVSDFWYNLGVYISGYVKYTIPNKSFVGCCCCSQAGLKIHLAGRRGTPDWETALPPADSPPARLPPHHRL